jgi:hypothetical protein
MNSKQVSNVLIVVCLIGMAVWWRWHTVTPPPKKTRTVQTRPQSQQSYADDAPMPDYSPPPQPDIANMDPAMLQALLETVARQQQQQLPAAYDPDPQTTRTVVSNLRQLQYGAEQYFTESGRTSVASADIVGTNSTQAVKPFPTVAGETYTDVILQGSAVTASGVSGARTITYQ